MHKHADGFALLHAMGSQIRRQAIHIEIQFAPRDLSAVVVDAHLVGNPSGMDFQIFVQTFDPKTVLRHPRVIHRNELCHNSPSKNKIILTPQGIPGNPQS